MGTVVKSQLGRLENIAPVHKSELRKCVDFILRLDVDLGCFLSPFGLLWETLGAPWILLDTLHHLGVTWPAIGSSGVPLGLHFIRLWHLF